VNVTIRDRDVLGSLRPADLLNYLRASGWQRESEIGEKAELWVRSQQDGPEMDVLVPLRREAGDFALRASELLRTLEEVEHRSQQQIIEDIGTSSADVVRIRAVSPEAASGSILLDSGVIFFEQAREMVLAAACATVQSKAYWARRKPAPAAEYIKKVRLGQTERGSYVITIQSPVTPALRTAIQPEQPFERQVIETLSSSLSAVHSAARQAAATGDLEPFRTSVDAGVSANLCDAIVRLFEASPTAQLEVSVSWSRSRPSSRGAISHTTLSSDFVPVIAEASRLFKEIAPEDDFELFGFVERLDRPTEMPFGQVYVNALIEGRPRRVSIQLGDPEYQLAIRAHGQRLSISCVGDLIKTGRSYQLQNPRDFRIVDIDAS
jgi:hypothetical protein